MGREEVELAREAYDAFNRGDLTGALRRLDAGIEWRMSERFARGTRVFHGHDGVRQVWQLFDEALEDMRVQPRAIHDGGDGMVLAEVRITGQVRGGGEAQAFDLVHVWTMRERRAVLLEVYSTLSDACAALGITVPDASSSSISPPGSGRANR